MQNLKFKTRRPVKNCHKIYGFWLAALCIVSTARAALVPIDGTFGFVPLGSVNYAGESLQNATSISVSAPATLNNPVGLINNIPANYNGLPNDFAGSAQLNPLSQINLPSAFAVPAAWQSSLFVNIADFLRFSDNSVFAYGTSPQSRYRFDLSSLSKSSSGPLELDLYGFGTIRDLNGQFADTQAQLSLALTQSAPGAAVNASFSIATVAVPETGTFVAGLTALGFLLISKLASPRPANKP